MSRVSALNLQNKLVLLIKGYLSLFKKKVLDQFNVRTKFIDWTLTQIKHDGAELGQKLRSSSI
jgi:hypothetical protein